MVFIGYFCTPDLLVDFLESWYGDDSQECKYPKKSREIVVSDRSEKEQYAGEYEESECDLDREAETERLTIPVLDDP